MKGFHHNMLKAFLLLIFTQVAFAQIDLQLSVSPNENPITLVADGGQHFITFTVTNDIGGADEGDQTTVDFALEPGIDVINVSSTDTIWNCIQVTLSVTCNYNAIYPAGYSSDLILTVSSPVNPLFVDDALIVDLSNAAGDAFPSNNNITTSIDFVAAGGVDLSIVKSLTVGSQLIVAPGDPISFDLAVRNLTGGDATNVVVMDDILGNNLLFDAANSSAACTDSGSFIACTTSSLLSGDNITFTIATNVDTSAQLGDKVNTASVSANEPDPNINNNSGSQTFEVAVGSMADLDWTIVSDQSTYTEGDLITLDGTLQNPSVSTGAPSNVTVTTTLPVETVFNSAQVTTPSGWSCTHDGAVTGGDVTCLSQGTPVAIGTSTLIQIRANAITSTAGLLVNVMSDVTSDFDPNPSNDVATTSFEIFAGNADLAIQMLSAAGNYTVADSIFYNIQVNNPMGSPSSPSDVLVEMNLPFQVEFVNTDLNGAPGWTCNHDGSLVGGVISCDLGGTPFNPFTTDNFIVEVVAQEATTDAMFQSNISSAADNNLVNNTATQSDVINQGVSDFSISKTVSGTNFTLGDAFVYQLSIENPTSSTASPNDVIINDTLPAEVNYDSFSVNSISGTTISCNHDGSNNGGLFSCDTGGTPFPPGETVTIDINVTAASVSSAIDNSATVETIVDADGTGNNNLNSAPTIAVVGPNITTITATKSAVVDGAPILGIGYGETFEYVLQIQNTGLIDAQNVVVTDVLPTEVFWLSTQSIGWTCTFNGGPGTTNPGGDLTCQLDDPLAPAASAQIILEVVPTNSITTNNITNTMKVNGDNTGPEISASSSLSIQSPSANLTLSQNPSPVSANDDTAFGLLVQNIGNTFLNGIQLDSQLPVGFVYNGFSGSSQWSCSESLGTVSCTYSGSLNSNTNATLNLLTTAPIIQENQVYLLNSILSANQLSSNINKELIVNTLIVGDFENDLSLIKSASVSEIGQNEPFSYLLQVVNSGSESQTNFTLIDQLPAGVILQSTTGSNWNCEGSSALNCEFNGSLASGEQTQLTIEVRAPVETGVITNTASINLTQDENINNDISSVTVNVIEGQGGVTDRADLSVLVETDSPSVLNNEQVSWRINTSNGGPDTAVNVVISSLLPIGFVADNVQVGNGAECTLLTASLRCEIATLAVNQSNEIILQGGFNTGFTGLLINTVEVQSDTIDENPSNNTGSVEVMVSAVLDLVADLTLELNGSNQPVQQGGGIDLSFIAKNLGPDQAINAQISGGLSGLIEGVQLLNSGGWMCQVNNSALTCQYPGNLPVGVQSEISLRVQTQQVVQQSQPIVFNATISSDAMDSQPGNNMIAFNNEVTRTPTEDEIFAIFQNSVGSGASETVIQSIRNVSSYCARSYFMAIEGLCEEFIEDATPENGGAIINAMEELTPNEVAAQSNSAAEIITSQFRNVSSRLAQLRGGGGSGVNLSGLTGRYGNEAIPIGMLAYLNQAEDEQSVSNINDFVSPWGFFVNGSVSMGERDATGRELGFDFDTFGLTAGVDYRFSATKVLGVALGYANFDSEIEGEAEMQSTGLTLTGYGSFYLKDNFYVDTRISYGAPEFDQKRRINFTVDEIVIDRVATGKTNSSQYSVAVGTGYHFNKNAWNITPNASLHYVRTTIDAFQETGAGGFNFAFGEQEIKSMVWSVGTSVSKAISLKNGVISPQFDVNLSRETENDGGLLAARFISAPDDEIFWIGTDEPDRTYGSAGLGLVFIGANGKQAYINYRSIFGLEGFTRGTINVGARFEF